MSSLVAMMVIMALLRCGSYNLMRYGPAAGAGEECRQRGLAAVLRALDLDVVAVQEVFGPGAGACQLQALGERLGLQAVLPDGEVAVAHGGGQSQARFHVGVLWNPRRLRPERVRRCDGQLWHNLVALDAVVDEGPRVRFASYHGAPFGRARRCDEAERVVFALQDGGVPAVAGGDWNAVSADPGPEGGWHCPDPYVGTAWRPAYVAQCRWETGERGEPARWVADRRPGQVLLAGGLFEAAAVLQQPAAATCGHFPGEQFPHRAIDLIRITAGVVPALRGHQVVDTSTSRVVSDHLPVVVDLDPAAVDQGEGL